MPKSTIAEPYGKNTLSIIINSQTIFQSDYTILHSYQQNMSDPVSYHPLQHVVLSFFFKFYLSDMFYEILLQLYFAFP